MYKNKKRSNSERFIYINYCLFIASNCSSNNPAPAASINGAIIKVPNIIVIYTAPFDLFYLIILLYIQIIKRSLP